MAGITNGHVDMVMELRTRKNKIPNILLEDPTPEKRLGLNYKRFDLINTHRSPIRQSREEEESQDRRRNSLTKVPLDSKHTLDPAVPRVPVRRILRLHRSTATRFRDSGAAATPLYP